MRAPAVPGAHDLSGYAARCRSDLAYSYDLCETLGAGASAEVHRATHVASDEEVAIKVFTDSRSDTIHAACTEFVCAIRSAGPGALEYKELAFYKGKPALVMELGVQSLDAFIRVRPPGLRSTPRAALPCPQLKRATTRYRGGFAGPLSFGCDIGVRKAQLGSALVGGL